jgi:hypothetical protein
VPAEWHMINICSLYLNNQKVVWSQKFIFKIFDLHSTVKISLSEY